MLVSRPARLYLNFNTCYVLDPQHCEQDGRSVEADEFDAFIHVCIYGPVLRRGVPSTLRHQNSPGINFRRDPPYCPRLRHGRNGGSPASFATNRKYSTLNEAFYDAEICFPAGDTAPVFAFFEPFERNYGNVFRILFGVPRGDF